MISAYLRIKELEGPVRDRDTDKDGTISLLSVEHSLVSPRDFTSGMPTGKRQHLPIWITKQPDETSPVFYEALTRNQVFSDVELLFFGTSDRGGFLAGREEKLYTITLAKVFVAQIDFSGQDNPDKDNEERFPMREHIAFVYDKIRWSWVTSGREAEDNFSARL